MVEIRLNSSDETMDINDSISAGLSSGTVRASLPDVLSCKTLSDALRTILYFNTSQGNNETLTEDQEQKFEIIEQLRDHPEKMFSYLRKHFAKHFDIDLYLIAFDNEKFSLINKDNYNKNKIAFLSFDRENKIHGPLYITGVDGTRETVFSRNNHDICIDVYIYVAHLNDKKSSNGFPQIQEQQGVLCVQELTENTSIGNIPTSTNLLIPFYPVQVDHKTQSRIVLDQALQQMFRIIDNLPIDPCTLHQVLQSFISYVTMFPNLSPQDAIPASKDGIKCFSYLVQLAEQPIPIYQNEQGPLLHDPNNQPIEIQNETNPTGSTSRIQSNISLPNDLSTTTADTSIDTSNKYPKPTLIKLLNKKFHPRTLKEFSKTGSSPVQCDNLKQRDKLQIKVPSNDNIPLYLAMRLVDLNNQTHISKIIVPNKTKVENESLMNNNNLACLNFDACDKGWTFDCENKVLYSIISAHERLVLQKDIRIHMINLYQRGEIKRKAIEKKYLKQCKLAFWFCLFKNEKYQQASPIFYSNRMEECVTSTNKQIKKAPKRLAKTSIYVH